VEEVKVRKPRKKRVVKEKVASREEKEEPLVKPRRKKVAAKKKVEVSKGEADSKAEKPAESR
jgi:hypothetical protein